MATDTANTTEPRAVDGDEQKLARESAAYDEFMAKFGKEPQVIDLAPEKRREAAIRYLKLKEDGEAKRIEAEAKKVLEQQELEAQKNAKREEFQARRDAQRVVDSKNADEKIKQLQS